MGSELASQPLTHCPCYLQSEFSKNQSEFPLFIILHCPLPPFIALGLKCKSITQHLLLSVIWILSTFPTSAFTFPLLFQSTEWLASPPTSCTLIIHYLCVMLCPLSVMLLSFLPPFSSLTHTCTSGLSPSRSILWLDRKFQFPSHLPCSCSSKEGAESYLSSYLRKKPNKCWMNKGLLPHGSCWSGTNMTSLSFLKGHWIWGKLSGVP